MDDFDEGPLGWLRGLCESGRVNDPSSRDHEEFAPAKRHVFPPSLLQVPAKSLPVTLHNASTSECPQWVESGHSANVRFGWEADMSLTLGAVLPD